MPSTQFKVDFLAKHDMVVFHFHDYWHARRPDGIATGMVRELGWEKNADPEESRVFRFQGVTLAALARDMESIVLGHVVSEQAGMKYCAEWLKPFVP